jgi:hypothetical protein
VVIQCFACVAHSVRVHHSAVRIAGTSSGTAQQRTRPH